MAGFTSNSVDLAWQPIAIPAVCLLISFLGYSSQLLFHLAEDLDPGPLTKREMYILNTLLLCLWLVYYKACTVDAGRFAFPKPKVDEYHPPLTDRGLKIKLTAVGNASDPRPLQPPRWCRKCAAPKPARAHHCRHCKRCIPRMDHHCPWTSNCVSYTTFPHFLRFLVYTNAALGYLLVVLLFPRLGAIYDKRHLPFYLGPSMGVLIHLALLLLIGGFIEFVLFIMLVSTAKSWVMNTTMIENWEIDRHEALLAKGGNGCATCPHPNADSEASDFEDEHRLERIEFPYDLGFYDNMAQAMGSRNPILWFLPVFGSETELCWEQDKIGWSWPENEFNEKYGMWPPVDPEKERRERILGGVRDDEGLLADFEKSHVGMSNEDVKAAFRVRQEVDLARWQKANIMVELEEVDDYNMVDMDSDAPTKHSGAVDDHGPRVVELDEDDDDVPLAEIIRRRKPKFRPNGEN